MSRDAQIVENDVIIGRAADAEAIRFVFADGISIARGLDQKPGHKRMSAKSKVKIRISLFLVFFAA
jgi:hypothetical protein